MVELHLAKVDVAGSNPVSRSHETCGDPGYRIAIFFIYTQWIRKELRVYGYR